MPESVAKTQTPITVSFVFDNEKCQKHLDKVIEFQNQFIGKKNYNPFIWIRDNVTPLYNRLVGISKDGNKCEPEITKELQDAILQLPLTKDSIILKQDFEQKEQEQPKMLLTPAGIMLQNPTKK